MQVCVVLVALLLHWRPALASGLHTLPNASPCHIMMTYQIYAFEVSRDAVSSVDSGKQVGVVKFEVWGL